MDDFEIPVIYKNEEFSFPASIKILGYVQQIQVDLFGEIINFEPDEERNYRPVLTNEQLDRKVKVDIELLKRIAEVIEGVKS